MSCSSGRIVCRINFGSFVFGSYFFGNIGYFFINFEQSGSEQEQRYASKIKPIRQKGHWLLVTLLLCNVVVNETLPVLTNSVWTGGWPAVVISSSLIVIFGEILPQAICTRYGLRIGAQFASFVNLVMIILAPIAYPISKVLDYALGKTQGQRYKRAGI